MVLDETRYDVLLPPKEQGVGAWNRTQIQVSAKRGNSDDSSNTRSRKLRRVASSKLGDQNEGIWGDIIGGGFTSSDKRNSAPIDISASTDTQAKEVPTQQLNFFESEPSTGASGKSPVEGGASLEPKGFLQGCYFYMHGYSSKQVRKLLYRIRYCSSKLTYSGERPPTSSYRKRRKYCASPQ